MKMKVYLLLLLSFALFFSASQNVNAQCTPSAPVTVTNNTPVAISTGAPAVVTSTITVAGAPTYLYNLKVITAITHTWCSDLDITLRSPAGTIVTLTTDNGGSLVNVFNGTTWDDKANPAGQVPYASNNGLAADHVYTTNVVATPLVPEEPLGAFIGENPNGVWTITISDDATGDGGSLASWSLVFTGLATAPTASAPLTVTNNTPVAISTGAPAVVTSNITVAGAGTQLLNVKALTNITHTWGSDLDITLRSPAGTIVTLTTDNGGSLVNVFNGTTWDDKANPAGQVPYASNNGVATDHTYTTNVTATPLTPEEALAAFVGENPNGVWTLTISDDATGDGGSLALWSLTLVTSTCGPPPIPCAPSAPVTVTNSTPVAISTGAPAVVTSTITVAGAPAYLYNLKVITAITHTWCSDLDITLRSPAGTIVTLTTDNGGSLVNVFNGTTWDDKANPAGQVPYASNNGLAADHSYTSNVVATPLAPEEPLGAFIGENPNGVWTITISDDATGDGGSLASWSLVFSGLASAPIAAAPVTVTNNTPVAISTGAPAVVTSNITVAGAGTQLLNVKALTNITHTWGSDLDITLRSPAGTIVTLTTDNGGSLVNVFNGTTWDDKANPAGQVPYASNNGVATDHTYTSNVTATPLTPEEALAAFVGENPNGVWTLTISDDATGDGGSLDSWALTLVTSLCSVPACAITCPANITVNKQAGTCGATVTFPAPTTTGACGAVTVVPASGSVFPVGVTTVNASVAGVGGPTCSFTVTVVDTEVPSITTHPASRTNCEADNPTFTVVATNAVSYQWQVSAGGAFTNIQGATGATLTLTNVPLSANGFQYRVVVTGPCTPVTSNAATLTLNPLPTVGSITASPRSKLSPGQTTSLSLTTYNGFPGNFGWYRNNVLVQTTLTPNLNNLTIDSLGVYKLVFTDIKGCKATTTDFPLEAEPDFRFFVFPNPNNGHFQVRFYAYELGVKRTLSVFDSKGNLVFKREFIMTSPYEKMDVDVSRYTKGYYHVELRDNSGKYLGSGSALFIQ